MNSVVGMYMCEIECASVLLAIHPQPLSRKITPVVAEGKEKTSVFVCVWVSTYSFFIFRKKEKFSELKHLSDLVFFSPSCFSSKLIIIITIPTPFHAPSSSFKVGGFPLFDFPKDLIVLVDSNSCLLDVSFDCPWLNSFSLWLRLELAS